MDETERRAELQSALLEATRLAESGGEAEALNMLLEVEPSHTDDSTLLCMIGALAGQVGAEGMAVDYFNRCLALNPVDVEVLIAAGAGLSAANDPGAEPALRLAVLTAPENAIAHMHYGSVLVRSGLVEQGIQELLTARTLDPSDPMIRRDLGASLLFAGRQQEALDELEAAVAADPENPAPRLLWGLALLQEDEIARAAEELHPLGESMGEDPAVQLLLALAFALEEWEEESWIAFSRAEAVDPPYDPATLREVEDALSEGGDAIRQLLIEELAPITLRERLFLV